MNARPSEHVLYITLVDFLLQLLFLAMVVGVIYASAKPAEDAVAFATEVKQLTGISDLTEITDLLTRMGPLQTAAKAREKTKPGAGLPSCLPDKQRLASFHAYPDRIELGAHQRDVLLPVLDRLGLSIEALQGVSLPEFQQIFAPLKQIYPDCRFHVTVIEHSFDTRPRDAVRAAFLAFPVRAKTDHRF